MPQDPPRTGDKNEPDPPGEPQHIQAHPPKIADTYILFSDYEGPQPEVCLHQWYLSPFIDPDSVDEATNEPLKFHTAEQYMMYWKVSLLNQGV